MQITKSVSVIIPTYNGKILLQQNISTVYEALKPLFNYEIIVVDDASSDDTLDYLHKFHPDILTISNSKNLGFSQSMNKGIFAAKCDLVLLLNNDIGLAPNYMMSSLHYFDLNDTFGVMGSIMDSNKTDTLEGIKIPVSKISGIGYKDHRENNYKEASDLFTMYLCGGNALIDRKKLIALGGFSLQYEPFYLEDVDLSLRAWLSGWKSYYNYRAISYHIHSATIKKYYKSDFISMISKRNRLRLNYIFLTGKDKITFLLIARIKYILYFLFHSLKIKSSYNGYEQFFNTYAEIHPFTNSASNKLKRIFNDIYINWQKNRRED